VLAYIFLRKKLPILKFLLEIKEI